MIKILGLYIIVENKISNEIQKAIKINKMKEMTQDFLQKALYELLYNNVLLPRTHEIDHEEEREAFDGSTKSLVQLHKENQISFEQFCSLSDAQITDIIAKSKNLPIDKERFFALCDM